jgi:proton glutamate symport protein
MRFLRQNHWQILMALALAVAAGLAVKAAGPAAPGVASFLEACGFVGAFFMNALKMIIVPLVATSIICGIGSVGRADGFGRLGLKTLGFYLLSTFLAVLTGLAFVNLVKPGLVDGRENAALRAAIESRAGELAERGESAGTLRTVEQARAQGLGPFGRTFMQLVPDNIVRAAAEGQMLGLIVFSLMLGIALAHLGGPPGETLRAFFEGLNALMITITHWVMAIAPLGIFGLVTGVVAAAGGEIFQQLAKYFATVVGALGFHFFITLPLLLVLLARINPRRHFAAMRAALATAFSTASSAATLPTTLACLTENARVSRRVSSFTVPLGATVNMDGTALYECVAVIFVAQVLGHALSLGDQFAIVVLALMTSIGVAGVPSASLVAIVVILQSVRIEGAEAAIAVLFSVDRLLDMSRTAVNIFGDSCAAVVIARSEGENEVLAPPQPDART